MINQIYPDLACLRIRYCITETLLPYHFMWIHLPFCFWNYLWCNCRLWSDLDWLCGYLGALVNRLDLSLLLINQIRIYLDIGNWLNRRFFIKRTGSWTWTCQ